MLIYIVFSIFNEDLIKTLLVLRFWKRLVSWLRAQQVLKRTSLRKNLHNLLMNQQVGVAHGDSTQFLVFIRTRVQGTYIRNLTELYFKFGDV